MAVVEAFTSIEGTENAGMVAYYRAPGCTEVTIGDVLPILSKINYYEDEYVIGEMLIWDTGSQSGVPNNCAMVKVIVYNDGWICAWFDKTTQNQIALGAASYVNSSTLSGWGSSFEYEDRYNNCILEITGSDDGHGSSDPACPDGTLFAIQNSDYVNGRVQIYSNDAQSEHFNSGYSYNTNIYMTNGNIIWWNHVAYATNGIPPNNSNRLYRCIYQIWDEIKYSSNSTNNTTTNALKVYMYDSQTDIYTDETTDFNDIGVSDCQVFPTDEAIDDAFYIGGTYKFNGVSIDMGTNGVGSTAIWEYWNGSVWETLLCTDGSSGFTASGELTFNPPDNWEEKYVNGYNYYWVRSRITAASYTTTPLLTQGQIYIQLNLSYTDPELGLYNFEFLSANYCLICGSSEKKSEHYYYYTILPGKYVYDCVMNVAIRGYYSGYWSPSNIYLNGLNIYSINEPDGFTSISCGDISYNVGIQNTILIDAYSTQALDYSVGTVLITS